MSKPRARSLRAVREARRGMPVPLSTRAMLSSLVTEGGAPGVGGGWPATIPVMPGAGSRAWLSPEGEPHARVRRRRRPVDDEHPLHDLRPCRPRGGPPPARARADPAPAGLGGAQPDRDL